MAGQKQPIELVVAKGKKNLTKTEIEERKATEVTAASDKVRPPTYLPKNLRKEFTKIAKELLAIGIITNLDVDALARYVVAQELYRRLIEKLLPVKAEDMLNLADIINSQDKLFKQCRAAAMDLGLTISSRCKLVMPIPKESAPEDPFARFVKT